jgi:hypothetical protein
MRVAAHASESLRARSLESVQVARALREGDEREFDRCRTDGAAGRVPGRLDRWFAAAEADDR